MSAEQLPDRSQIQVSLASKEWIAAVGGLFRALHGERFPLALRDAIGQICDFDSMVVTAYAGNARPKTLFHDFDEVQATINISFYETGPYLLDPFYLACREGREAGAYRLGDLTPAGFFKSEYYRTFYRRIRLSDEMGLIMRAGVDRWLVVSLARRVRRPKFDLHDLATVNAAFGILSGAVLSHWGGQDVVAESDGNHDLQDRLRSFASDTLSPRESEIVQLILQGHSTPSAAALLDIAEGTVKVHRRHAYAKLGITSQAELFSLATRFLAEHGV
jgi:DNA-binding CsgD family transcriptional regulator